jgi:hypothetical protein
VRACDGVPQPNWRQSNVVRMVSYLWRKDKGSKADILLCYRPGGGGNDGNEVGFGVG